MEQNLNEKQGSGAFDEQNLNGKYSKSIDKQNPVMCYCAMISITTNGVVILHVCSIRENRIIGPPTFFYIDLHRLHIKSKVF